MNKRIVAVVAVLALCSSVWAGPYKGNGYSLTIPDDWTVADKETKQAVGDYVKSHMNLAPNVDALFSASDPQTNINVTILKSGGRISESEIPAVREGFLKSLQTNGVTSNIFDSRIVRSNGRDYILLKSDNKFPQFDRPVRQWALIGSTGGKTYLFTFTTFSNAATWEPVFDQTIQSIKLDGGPLGWFFDLHVVVKGALIGGLIGGVFALIHLAKKKRAPAQPPVNNSTGWPPSQP